MSLVQFICLSRGKVWVCLQNVHTGAFREEVITDCEFKYRWGHWPRFNQTEEIA